MGANLEGTNLGGANLTEACLEGSFLWKVTIGEANLYKTQINKIGRIDGKGRLVWKIVNQVAVGLDLQRS